MSLLGETLKSFLKVWLLVLTPVVGAVMLLIYKNIPILGAAAAYGAFVTLIAFLRSKPNKVEIDKNLSIVKVSSNPVHPELLKLTLILNGIFAVEALLLYLAIP